MTDMRLSGRLSGHGSGRRDDGIRRLAGEQQNSSMRHRPSTGPHLAINDRDRQPARDGVAPTKSSAIEDFHRVMHDGSIALRRVAVRPVRWFCGWKRPPQAGHGALLLETYLVL